MDTPIFCVYNLARRVFLTSKVTVADAINQPLKVLKDLVALESGSSGLWLNPLHSRPNLPKLFPFDLAYLDADLRVVEIMEVLPGLELPAHRREVASAVVLPSDTLRSTQTGVGDHLMVCPKEEAERRIAGEAADGSGKRGVAATVEKAAEAESVKTPAVSITEVIIEHPHELPAQVQQNVEHGAGLEDLFANWVDSRSAPPSWIAQKAREREAQAAAEIERAAVPETRRDSTKQKTLVEVSGTKPDAEEETLAEASRTVEANGTKPDAEEVAGPDPAPTPPMIDPPSARPSRTAAPQIPQRPQTTTFTIGQHGIWQLNTPTVVSPNRPVSKVYAKGAGGGRRAASVKPEKEPTGTGSARPATAQSAPGTASPANPAGAENTPGAKPSPISQDSPTAREGIRRPKPKAASSTPANELVRPKLEVDAPVPSRPAPDGGAGRPHPAEHLESVQEAREVPPEVEDTLPASKPVGTDFAMSVKEMLERLQVPTVGSSTSKPKQAPASAEEIPVADPQATVKAGPVSSGAPGGPVSKPIQKASPSSSAPDAPVSKGIPKASASEPQQGIAAKSPLPRFLKPRPEEETRTTAPERVDGNPKNAAALQHGFRARLKRWLNPTSSAKSDRRRALRRYVPGMVAHYFTGGAPKPHQVADISMSGFYLLTEDRWIPDTMIRMTLQKPCAKGERKQSITVLARIVRRGSDGIAAEFVMEESLDPGSRDILPAHATDRFSLARFL